MPIVLWRNMARWFGWFAAVGFVVLLTMWLVPQARVIGAGALRLGLLGTGLSVAATWLVSYATAARWDVARARMDLAADLRRRYRDRLAPLDIPAPLPVRWSVPGEPEALHRFGDVHGFFRDEVPGRRLVILGGAGSGKSVLALQLAADLLADETVKRIPFILDATTWNPATDLWQWIAGQLVEPYPALRKRIVLGITGDQPTLAGVLADTEHLLPILDGFDALPRKARVKALQRLNGLGSRVPLVLICRTKEYHNTVSGGRGLGAATTIALQPLDPTDIATYLVQNSDPPASRWDAVLADLRHGPRAQLAALLTSPALTWLVHKTHEEPDTEPAALLSVPGSMRDHLTDRFVETVAGDGRWPADAVPRWLATLARHSTGEDGEIRWWRLVTLTPPGFTARVGRWTVTTIFLIAALMAGLLTGGPVGAIVMGGLIALVAAGTHRQMRDAKWRTRTPARLRMPRGPRMVLRVAAAVVPALTTAVALRAGAATWLQAGWVGLAVLILLGQALTVPEELRLGTSPARVLASNRALALVRGMLAGPGVAAVVVLVTMRFSPMPLAVAYGIAFGAVAAFGGASTTAWCQFQMTRFWLAAHGVLPLRTMAFLHDAERWGILRPVGGGYEFCDPHVRRRLVASAPPPIAPRQPQLGGAPARVGSPVR